MLAPPGPTSPQGDSPRDAIQWLGTPLEDLKTAMTLDGVVAALVDAEDPRAAVAAIPAVDGGILGSKVELAEGEGHDDLGLEEGELLADTVAGALFEGPPGLLGDLGEREGGLVGQEALGDEGRGPREVGLVAVDGVRDGPDVEARERVREPRVRVREHGVSHGRLRPAHRRGGREEAEDFLEHGRAVGQVVDEVRVSFEQRWPRGAVAAEDRVEFGDDAGMGRPVEVQQVENVGDGGGGGVMTGENEGLDLLNCVAAEGCVHVRFSTGLLSGILEFFVIHVESEVDDRALSVCFAALLLGAAVDRL